MASRLQRLLRMHKATDQLWRYQIGHVSVIDKRLLELDGLESAIIDSINLNMPYQSVLFRLDMIHHQRIILTEERSIVSSKARDAGFHVKRIAKLLSKLDQ